jgi:hypothetical protein
MNKDLEDLLKRIMAPPDPEKHYEQLAELFESKAQAQRFCVKARENGDPLTMDSAVRSLADETLAYARKEILYFEEYLEAENKNHENALKEAGADHYAKKEDFLGECKVGNWELLESFEERIDAIYENLYFDLERMTDQTFLDGDLTRKSYIEQAITKVNFWRSLSDFERTVVQAKYARFRDCDE